MNTWKRILSMVLALVMIVGMVPFNALNVFAAEVDATTNTIRNEGTTISEYNLMTALNSLVGETGYYKSTSYTYSPGYVLTSNNQDINGIGNVTSMEDGKEYTVSYYTRKQTGTSWIGTPEYTYTAATFTFTYEVYYVITASVPTDVTDAALKVTIGENTTTLTNGQTVEVDYGTEVTYAGADVTGYTATVSGDTTSPVTASGTVSVSYTKNNYTVTWDANGGAWADGSTSQQGTLPYGDAITAPETNPAKNEAKFAGWKNSSTGEDYSASDTIGAANVTYTAKWADNSYEVKYWLDSVGGTQYGETHYVVPNEGGVVPTVDEPSKDGYVFAGWTNGDLVGNTPVADVDLVAIWKEDTNGNGKADENEKITVTVSATNGTATLSGGNDKVLISQNGDVYTIVYDSTTDAGKTIIITTTANSGETQNVGYYLDEILVNGEDKTATKSFTAGDATVTVTFEKEEFELPDAPEGGWVVEVNGFSNETKVETSLKVRVLDAIFGKDNYDEDDYKVELLTTYNVGDIQLGERYYNVEGETGKFLFWDYEIPASWFVNQLVVDGLTENDFKITKLAASNKSGIDLYHEKVMIVAKESREEVEASEVTLSTYEYVENELDDMITAIKNNILVNGEAVDANDVESVVLVPETALDETKQTYTAQIKLKGTADYLGNTDAFEITVYGTLKSYKVTWTINGVTYDTTDVYYGYAPEAPAYTVPEGHTFSGWTLPETITGTTTLDATLTVNTYKVTWTVNGVEYTTTDVDYGTTVTAPAYTTPEGHTFSGWTVPETMPAESITLDASLTINQYTVSWEYKVVENGEVVTKTYTQDPQDYGTGIVPPTADEVPTQYVVGNVTYTAIWPDVTGATVPAHNVTYTADYTSATAWVVTYVSNGGSAVSPQTIIVEKGETVTKPADPTWENDAYRFDGWYTDVNCTVAYEGWGTTPEANVTLYAKWTQYVAQVGETKYVSLAEAITAANNGDTIYVLADHRIGNSGVTVNGKTLTIDLGGHEVTSNSTTFAVRGSSSTGDGYLTLVNGTVIGNTNAGGSVSVSYRGTLVLGEDLVVKALHEDTSTSLVGSDGTLIINDGAYISKVVIKGSCNATINAGSIVGQLVKEGTGTLTIYGGYFSQDVSDYVADGYACVEDTDNADGYEATIYKVENHDTTNGNGVKDEDEIITVTQVGENGSFTVSGAVSIGDGKYVFDSVNNPNVTIVATPVVSEEGVSASYVKSIGGAALTYGDGFVATATVAVANGDVVEIVFEDVPVVKDPSDVVMYNFFTKEIPYDDIYNAVISAPPIMEGTEVTYTYYVRPAMSQTVTVDSLDLDASVKTLLSTLVPDGFTFNMEELWLPLDAQIEESVDLNTAVSTYLTKERIEGLLDIYNAAYDAAYDAYIAANGDTWYNKIAAAAEGAAAGVKAATADIQAIYDEVYAAAMYYGAHNFGYNAEGAETVDEIIKIEYNSEAMYWTAEATVTLKDPRVVSYIDGTDIELTYRDYTDEDILAMFGLVDEAGNAIDGAVYSLQLTDPYTFEGKNVSDTAYELTIKFAGNADYRAAEKTVNVTIVKASASIDVPNINVTYGDGYDPTPSVSMGNKYGESAEIIDSLVEIIIGLDVNELEITADGVSGLATHIQILLPEDETLATVFKLVGLDVYGEGVTLSLTELQSYLDQIDDLLSEFDSGNETMDTIASVLESVTGLVDLSNIEITFGGNYPTDIGVYLYGAVSTSSNYETAYDVGYIIIKPKTEQVYLDWNYTDTNGVFTWALLNEISLGATAYDDAAYASVNATATEQVLTLFFGVDEEGNLLYTMDASELGNGVYTEIAFIAEFGNEFYYAEPIVRPVVIVPNLLDVQIVDEDGNALDVFEYEFDNTEKTHYVTVDGKQVAVEINYVGVRTNTNTYESTTAPTHAGAYLAYVTYLAYNEAGELTAAGGDVAAIVIAPVESTITVDDKIVVVDPDTSYDLEETLVTVGSAVAGVKPDTTIISAQISTDGTYSENGWDAVNGTVNVDFPAWLDSFLAEHAPDVMTSGITVGQLVEKLNGRVDTYAEMLIELGATEEIANSFTNLVENVTGVLAEMPSDLVVTFDDDVSVKNVGAYVVIGVVTDSDHYPAVDAGVLVIVPDVTTVDLQWNYVDEDDIWTRELLKNVDLYAKAFDTETGAYDADATAKITYQFIGIDKNGNLVVTDTQNADELPNGAYIELAYIELEVDGKMTVSNLIARKLLIVPGTVEVNFVDVNGDVNPDQIRTFNNNEQVMDVVVTNNGQVVTPAEGELVVTYTGVQTNGQIYNSTTAPTNAGVYIVVAEYTEYTEGGSLANIGAAVGVLAIEPAESSIEVTGGTVTYDGEGHTATVETTGGNVKPDYTLISGGVYVSGDINEIGVDAFHGNVNIDFPKWLDEALAEHEFKTEGVDTAYLIDFISSYRDDLVAMIPVDELVALGLDETEINAYIEKLNGYIDELLVVLDKLPEDVALTFVDNITYTEPGYYFYYDIVTDSDHYPSTDTGLLVIEKMDALFGAWHTVVPYDGEGHTVYVPNDYVSVEGAPTMDYITMVVDREANTVNFILDADATYILNTIERILDIELPEDMDIADLRATLAEYGVDVDDFAGALVELIDTILADMEKPTDPQEYAHSTYRNLVQIQEILANLPTNGTITINGSLPVDVGAYEFYLLSYSQYYATEAASAVLFIEPIHIVIDDIANGKYYGEKDPDLEADVYYYSYEGLEIINSGAKGNYENDYSFKDPTDNINVDKVTVNTLPDDVDLVYNYTVTREEGEDVGEYALYINGTLIDSKNYVLETVEDDVFTIYPAEITITVNDASKVYGEKDPTIDYTFTVNKGVVTEEKIGLNITREEGQDVGSYNYVVEYTESKNWKVTAEPVGALTITPAEITSVEVVGTYTYNGKEQTATLVVKAGDLVLTEDDYTVTGNTGKDAKTYTVEVEGTGNYTGTANTTWTITPAEITSVEVVGTYTYNGKEQTATLVVKAGELVLTEGDYEVTGNTGTNAGEYTVTVEGTGNYTGTASTTWTITPAEITSVEVVDTYIYNGNEQTATLVVKAGELELTEDDYTVIDGNITGTDADTYTVKVEGTGNYTGTASNTWTIAPAEINVTIESDEAQAGTTEIPTVVFSAEANNGWTQEEIISKLGLSIVWNAETVSGKLVHGVYDDIIAYTESDNYVVTFTENAKLTVTIGDYICWNTTTGVYYDDVTDALAAARGTVTTIQMLKDAVHSTDEALDKDEEVIIVYAGLTFDLNGYYVETENLLSYGVVMDSLTGTDSKIDDDGLASGGIIISNDTTKAWTLLQPENGGYLPVYDCGEGRIGCYRFYEYDVNSVFAYKLSANELRFYFQLLFDEAEGYLVLSKTSDSSLNMVLDVEWEGISETFEITYTMADATVKEYATNSYKRVSNGAANNQGMYLYIKGLKNLDSGTDITATPSVVTDSGVTASSATMSYTVE